MPHPLMQPEAQAILAKYSFDDQLGGILYANSMMPQLNADQKTIYGMKSIIYWLIARGAVIPPAVMAEIDEWNPPDERI